MNESMRVMSTPSHTGIYKIIPTSLYTNVGCGSIFTELLLHLHASHFTWEKTQYREWDVM